MRLIKKIIDVSWNRRVPCRQDSIIFLCVASPGVSDETTLPITSALPVVRRPRSLTPPRYLEPLADPASAPARAQLSWISKISEVDFGEALWKAQKDKVSYKWCIGRAPCVSCAQRGDPCTFAKTNRSSFLPCMRCRNRRVHCTLSYEYAAYRLEQVFGIPSSWTHARIAENWGLGHESRRALPWAQLRSRIRSPFFNRGALHVVEDDWDDDDDDDEEDEIDDDDEEDEGDEEQEDGDKQEKDETEDDDEEEEKEETEENDKEGNERVVKPKQRSGKGVGKIFTIRIPARRPAIRPTSAIPDMRPLQPVAHTPRPLRPSPPLSPGPSRHSQRWSPRPSRPSRPPLRSSPGPPPSPVVALLSLSGAAPLRHVSASHPSISAALESTSLVPGVDTPFSPAIQMTSSPTAESSPVPGKSNLPMSPIWAAPPVVNISDASKDRLVQLYNDLAARIVRQNDAYAVLEEKSAVAETRCKALEEKSAVAETRCKALGEKSAVAETRCKALEEKSAVAETRCKALEEKSAVAETRCRYLEEQLAVAQSRQDDQREQWASRCRDLEQQLAVAQSRQKDSEAVGGDLQGQVDTWKDIAMWERRHGHAVEARESIVLSCVLSSSIYLEIIQNEHDSVNGVSQFTLDHLHRNMRKAVRTGLYGLPKHRPITDGIVFQDPTIDLPSDDTLAKRMLEEYDIRRRRHDAEEDSEEDSKRNARLRSPDPPSSEVLLQQMWEEYHDNRQRDAGEDLNMNARLRSPDSELLLQQMWEEYHDTRQMQTRM
ncbi:hypothetical protein D9615_010630 [Tricholomella constricta]|uniref:Zn(2)-C6 fungal-type domain-containing protein n=1 Tax=Tricholomella constricta TaxID=117010 RepID=A0A8H5LQX4_9AGAR|nr:hypothetical protein D9615_010630 [Tricholomella constricta]